MKEYVIGLTSLAFLASVVAALTPSQAKTTRQLKFLCSLVMICALIAPMLGFIESVSELGFDFIGETDSKTDEQLFVDSLSKLSAHELESSLAELISKNPKGEDQK